MRFLVIALAVALSLPLPPLTLTGGAAAEAASVAGSVTSSTGQVPPNAAVQLRDLTTGTVSATVMSSATGTSQLRGGRSRQLRRRSAERRRPGGRDQRLISLPAGVTVTDLGVRATAATAPAAAAGTGSSRTIVAVVAAAVAAGVTGIVAVGHDGSASPRSHPNCHPARSQPVALKPVHLMRHRVRIALIVTGLLCPSLALAQGETGGPDPAKVRVRLGALWLNPSISLSNLGVDQNVFNDPPELPTQGGFHGDDRTEDRPVAPDGTLVAQRVDRRAIRVVSESY